MSDENRGISAGSKAWQHIILFGLILTIPSLPSTLFGLVYFFVPLVVLFYMYKWEHGFKYVLGGLVIATVASAVIGSLGTLLFTVTFIAPGYILAESAFREDSPVKSGLKATLSLIGCWLALLIAFTVITGVNPISDFINSLDQGIEETLTYYRQSDSADPETINLIEQSFYQMKVLFPKVMPSMIAGFAIISTWFTMISGNIIIRRFTGYKPWINHQAWSLPAKLIWFFIGSAIISLLPLGSIRLIGINALIILSILYFLQGFSIFVFFMYKWNIPLLLRAFLYGMVLFQSFGTILLLVIGVGDVWFDLRHLQKNSDDDDSGDDESIPY